MNNLPAIVSNLKLLLDHLLQRHSVSDLIDDKNQQEIMDLQEIYSLSLQVCERMENIYKRI